MSAANLILREAGESSPLTTFTFTVTAGTPTAAVVFDVWNTPDDPLGDTAENVRLQVYEHELAEAGWFQDRTLTAGRWIQMRVTAPYTTGWQDVGLARPFRMRPIAGDDFATVEMRANVPASEFDSVVEIGLEPQWNRPYTVLGAGFFASGMQGIASGIGDGSRSFAVEVEPTEPSSPADDTVTLGDYQWIFQGEYYVKLEHDLTFDTTAADGALSVGQAYWLGVSYGAGTETETKGDGATYPLDVASRPEPPEGEIVRVWIQVPETLEIEAGDIFDVSEPGSFKIYNGPSLTQSVGAGVAVVSDRLLDPDNPDAVVFPPSETGIEVYLLPSGGKEATVDGRPDDRALLIYNNGETDADEVLTLQDVRPFLRTRPGCVRFRFNAALAANQFSYASLVSDGDAIITYPIACELILDSNPTDNTAGETRADIELWDGTTGTSLFPSSGTMDRRPVVPVDATDMRATGIPETRRLPKGSRLRAKIISIPSGGTAPAGGEVVLYFEDPGF